MYSFQIRKREKVAIKQIFVNMPVKNLKKSMEFFSKLGFSFNAQFTDDTAACMIVSDDIYVMLLTHPKFKTFTPREICDTAKNTEVLVCLSSGSRSEVDEMFARPVRLEAQRSTSRKTTVLCMVTDFKTPTDIFG